MTDAPPLDFAMIRARSTEIAREFEAMLSGKPIAVDPSVLPLAIVPTGTAIDPIRADCELLEAWEFRLIVGQPAIENKGTVYTRRHIVEFVMKRRGVVERPGWAAKWIAGDGTGDPPLLPYPYFMEDGNR